MNYQESVTSESDSDSDNYDSDNSSTVSELEHELQDLLNEMQPLVTSKEMKTDVNTILGRYGEHGSKQKLQSDISKFLSSSRGYNDIQETHAEHVPYKKPPGGERMTDPESAELVTSLPFRLQQTFTVPPNVTVDSSIVSELNRIFEVHQTEAEVSLAYYSNKYGPEAIWRSGIRSLILSRTEDLLRFPGDTYLGLLNKQRSILTQAFEEFPKINQVERRLLCRAANVHPAIVDEFWSIMTKKRLPYAAMKVVATAKEMRKDKSMNQHSNTPDSPNDVTSTRIELE